MTSAARVLLVEVHRVVVLDRAGELADLTALDVHGDRLAGHADVARMRGHQRDEPQVDVNQVGVVGVARRLREAQRTISA
jgi:hypothetical protein